MKCEQVHKTDDLFANLLTWACKLPKQIQEGVQGDASPPAGARGVPATFSFFQRPPQAARER